MNRKFYLAVLLLGTFYIGGGSIYAQNGSGKQLPVFSQSSLYGSFNVDVSHLNLDQQFISEFKDWAGLTENHTLVLENEYVDELSIKHSIYQLYYKNIKVIDESVTLHSKDGRVIYINGELTKDITAAPTALLSSAELNDIIASDLGSARLTLANTENVFVKTANAGKVVMQSATRVEVLSQAPIKAFTYFVDNTTKQVIKKLKKIYHADTPSTSATFFKGNQPITVDSYNGGYRLKDNARNIHTLNGTNIDGTINMMTGELGGATEYISSNANFTANSAKPAVEVHWGMAKAYDYYNSKHSRNSYDGMGSIIRNYYNIDFSEFTPGAPSNYGFNAAAIDQSGVVAMVYGNGNYPGSPGLADPFVGIDVAGHEYSHLVIGRNGRGGLNYEGESGAINESIADMFGTAIEFYSGISPNWTIGENIINVAPGFMRSMSNPNSGPAMLESEQPDTYGGTYWKNPNDIDDGDQGGVHTNSGVGNFWFYLLSVGGSGTNDIANAYSVTGITIAKAEKIIYRALTAYMTPNSTYLDAYNYTRQAAADLYGANSNEALQNVKAWYAVGIGSGLLSTDSAYIADSSISIYPNPVTQNNFTVNVAVDKDAAYELYDVSGKLIITSKKLNFGNNMVQVTGVQTGVYMLKVTIGGSSVTKKLIIQ